jgi:putative alpha-1,2-mannosidase
LSFNAIAAGARSAWSARLKKIGIGGGTEAQKRTFYTALYHAQLEPTLTSDVTGQYMGPDDGAHALSAGQKAQYGTFSGWDVYRAQVQLLTLLDPKMAADLAQSLFNYATQRGGEWDRWLLEHAAADYGLYRLGAALEDGRAQDFLDRSHNWRNVFDADAVADPGLAHNIREQIATITASGRMRRPRARRRRSTATRRRRRRLRPEAHHRWTLTTKGWLPAATVTTGATLVYTLGGTANRTWGSGPSDVPPQN